MTELWGEADTQTSRCQVSAPSVRGTNVAGRGLLRRELSPTAPSTLCSNQHPQMTCSKHSSPQDTGAACRDGPARSTKLTVNITQNGALQRVLSDDNGIRLEISGKTAIKSQST